MSDRPLKRWWTEDDRYGLHYRADRENPNYRREMLILFVHGFLGDARGTFGELPFQLMEQVGIDADAFSFRYPSKPWQRLSMEREAKILSNVLRERYPPGVVDAQGGLQYGYRHILVVSHSAGGLLVKAMLRHESRRQDLSDDDRAALVTQGNLARMRRIVNLGVPHRGGRFGLTIPLFLLYHVLFLVASLPFYAITLLTQGTRSWGYHDLGYRLLWRNPWAVRLHRDVEELERFRREQSLPFPHSISMEASDDMAVPLGTGFHRVFRGVHTSLQRPEGSEDPVLRRIVACVSKYADEPGPSIADRTLLRGSLLDSSDHVGALLATRDAIIEEGGLDQSRAHRTVVEALHNQTAVTVLITGTVGVGKSSVLRRVAQTLAANYLFDADEESPPPLPVIIPLQQVKLSADSTQQIFESREPGRALLEALLDDWCEWVNDNLLYGRSLTKEWVLQRILEGSCVLILDSVDEFLVYNIRVQPRDIVSMMSWLEESSKGNSRRSTLVLGMRSTHPYVVAVRPHSHMCVEIKQLSRADAKLFAPDLETMIDDAAAGDVLLTPLVLERLRGRAAELEGRSLSDPSTVLSLALHGIIKSSRVQSAAKDNGVIATHDQILDALTAIGWAFFTERRASLDLATISAHIESIAQEWTAEAQRSSNRLVASVAEGFRLVQKSEFLGLLLARTLFHGLGRERYRSSHAVWADLLAARYLAVSLETMNFKAIAHIGGTEAAYRRAGQMLRAAGFEVNRETVDQMLTASASSKGRFIGTNFFGVLITSEVPIAAAAITRIMDAIANMDLLAKIVLFNGVNRRALAAEPSDPSARSLHVAFLPLLLKTARDPGQPALLRSISYCYAEAYAKRFGTTYPSEEWRVRLGSHPDHGRELLSLVSEPGSQPPEAGPEQRYIQLAWTQILSTAVEDPARPISLAHYLFVLVTACQHLVQIPEVDFEMATVFAEHSYLKPALVNYSLVPAVGEIFHACNAIWHGEVPPDAS